MLNADALSKMHFDEDKSDNNRVGFAVNIVNFAQTRS